jgi:hypothetical protein
MIRDPLDNRIGYFEDHALRYDLVGNRTEQFGMKQDSKGRNLYKSVYLRLNNCRAYVHG